MIIEMTGQVDTIKPTIRHRGKWTTRQILSYAELLRKIGAIRTLTNLLQLSSEAVTVFAITCAIDTGGTSPAEHKAAFHEGCVYGYRFRLAELYMDALS